MGRSIAVALATFVVGAALSLVVSAATRPASAREFESLVLVKERPTFKTFKGIPGSLAYARKPDPDFCRAADYCDTIPLKIPTPDVAKGAGFKMIFDAKNTDGADLDFYVWDNKQLKKQFGKCQPGAQCYDPLESDYTDLLVVTDPITGGPNRNGVYEIGEPDLVDYNITVLNFGGTSTGYTIYLELQVEDFEQPVEVRPPDHGTVVVGGSGSSTGGLTPTPTPEVAEPTLGDPADLPTLNDLLIERDPDLLAIREQDLADQLAAPPAPITRLAQASTGPPPPVSGLTLLLWLAVVPGALAGAVSALVQRRRVQIPDLG